MGQDRLSQSKLDYNLLFILFLMAIVSAIAIHSAEATLPEKLQNINFAYKQLQWYAIGAGVIALTMIIDYDRFFQIAWYLYGFGMLLLLGLELNVPGTVTNKGATSWYKLPGGNFQPSELMKIFMIIVLSRIIVNHREKYPEPTIKDDFRLLGKIALTVLPPLILLAKQPDLGMSMVFVAITGSLVLVSGIRWRIIFGIILSVVAVVATVVFIFFQFPDFFHKYIIKEDYQLNRFYGWLAPYEYSNEQGFQLIRSLLAIGSGELYGKGFGNLQVYLPEAHTDFIFGVISEQFGFIGASVVISLFFLLVYRMVHIALESNDLYGSYLCAGVIGMITFQVFQNIGMTIGLVPITGLPLPFISYGGSSLATYMLAIGLVLNVHSRTKKFMFSSDE
ncbi:FtsW/RodA/SpoVE family cell cycle protein [Parageobacillus thermoglucosidasius]|uniref:Rod shape-determining protein RodA n=1 Tax=Parageobacillus thermoglucosidasius TaxID=1426 RepID=A0AAN0YP09_PARTM|nr:FtsW/RodA/SpoVE family cell cycle protein [Parageobacillus thermoglucosidasius]ALF09853.1 rod shape-determining protein RodA [Parageobacillus thermoglucosidasius]ANZ29934.1 rod shape-determining protein RodA [Parageobacillus thermoglucosidasius]APM80672.1 rod shape-determining protein RodA [Parageobacillus thermoglucosidasius]KJX70323.1 cell cycle protein [Parageobacillus thermoglucosidasius]RDE21256.1 FtsW/RodA/SpoVE family cell cycle protein [Parageobacillus thermoglucosidasius]